MRGMDLYRHAAYTQHLLHTASGGLNSRMLAGYCGWLTCFLPWVALTPIAFGRGAGSRSTTLDGQATLMGSEGLYAYDVDGRLLWKHDFGRLNVGYAADVRRCFRRLGHHSE